MEKQNGGEFLSQIPVIRLSFVIDFDVNVELLQDLPVRCGC